ncbi:hypothetical protein T484DRAFT_3437940 [Baffinella frigidus]|nr:hypothetical protein T484DRAFT_3437940 [Cryptophyta sp. CCMP2293]
MVLEQWGQCEGSFEVGARTGLARLRGEQERMVRHLRETRAGFDGLLAAPDSKQKLVYTFQLEFNAIDLELRVRDETKMELHQRAEDVQQALWEIADASRDDAEAEHASIAEVHLPTHHPYPRTPKPETRTQDDARRPEKGVLRPNIVNARVTGHTDAEANCPR